MRQAERAVNIAEMRELARRRLPKAVFDFIDGGAEDERTLADNRAAFERVRLVPRVLVDVDRPDMATEIMGGPAAAPFVVAPMGALALAWPGADIALAKAAAAAGLPYTISTMSNVTLEEVADQVDGRLWFQLYVVRDRDFVDKLVDRAAAAGYEALALTVDVQVGAKRERDMRNGVTLPLRITPKLVWQAAQRPSWSFDYLRHGMPTTANLRDWRLPDQTDGDLASSVGRNLNAGYDYAALARLRERWKGKLLVKGVEHPADAARLVELGVDGIWISNHGGRQLDGAIATCDALPLVADAVGGRVPIIVDSGVRRGIDALKARALGAQAVAVGRACAYALAAGGGAGAARALDILTDELRRAMQLAGIPAIDAADRDILASQGWPGR
jgi:L-lactate dehydrogenase (cytochrome)/(S)-mandelate dehydrogenase